MSKLPISFSTEPVVDFSVEENEDGSFYFRGTNFPPLHYVTYDPEGESQPNYRGFISICQKMLNLNGFPAGDIKSSTPWDEVIKTGKGTLKFAST